MDTIPRLDRAEKRRLIHRGRKTGDPQTALRFLMIVKLADGISRQQVARDLRCAPATVVRTWNRYQQGGEEALLDQRAGNGQSKVDARFRAELWQVRLKLPTDFGWQRPTWTRELLALEMAKRDFPQVADCTMGRALRAIGARLTAPKPIVLCPWDRKRREHVLASLRHLANSATAAEPVFFEDEMDVHLNPTSSWTTTSSTRARRPRPSSPSSAAASCFTSSRPTAPMTTASSASGSTCTPT